MTHGVEEIGAKFYDFHPASQEQARELAVYVTEKLLETPTATISSNPI